MRRRNRESPPPTRKEALVSAARGFGGPGNPDVMPRLTPRATSGLLLDLEAPRAKWGRGDGRVSALGRALPGGGGVWPGRPECARTAWGPPVLPGGPGCRRLRPRGASTPGSPDLGPAGLQAPGGAPEAPRTHLPLPPVGPRPWRPLPSPSGAHIPVLPPPPKCLTPPEAPLRGGGGWSFHL